MSANGKMTFNAVVDFAIDPDEAAGILSEPTEMAIATLNRWLNDRGCCERNAGSYNLNQLREGLGAYLAERKIEERRLLVQCVDQCPDATFHDEAANPPF